MKLNELYEREKQEHAAERLHRRYLHHALLAALDQHGPLTITLDETAWPDGRKIYVERLPDRPNSIRFTASPKP